MTETNPAPIKRKSSLHSDQQDLIKLDDSTNDQQWHMVSSNKGQRKTNGSRRDNPEESQTTTTMTKAPKSPPPADAGKYILELCLNGTCDSQFHLCVLFFFFLVCFILFSYSLIFIEKPVILTSSPRAHSSVSRKSIQSRRRRPPTHSPSPPLTPNLTKRKSLQDTNSRELAFRQLTEQLWAAGLPSSTTACSMSIRSRCSSAPPSERGGDDGAIKINGDNTDREEENIDWDEPDLPDEGNSHCFECFCSYSLR